MIIFCFRLSSWAICDRDMMNVGCHGKSDAVDNVCWLLKWLFIEFDDCKTTVFVTPLFVLVVSIGGSLIWTGTVVLSLVGICSFKTWKYQLICSIIGQFAFIFKYLPVGRWFGNRWAASEGSVAVVSDVEYLEWHS